MSSHESFEVEVGDTPLSGRFFPPATNQTDVLHPAVLLCGGYPVEPPHFRELINQMGDGLSEAGFAAVTFEPRLQSMDDPNLEDWSGEDLVDDAEAIFEWLLEHAEIDNERLGVLGYSTGAVVAACLAGRRDSIGALSLVSPATVDSVLDWMVCSPVDEEERELPTAFEESMNDLYPVDDAAAYDRPTLILHGAADREIPPESSLTFLNRIENASHEVQMIMIGRADHGFSELEPRVACLEQLLTFFASVPPRSRDDA